MTSYGNTALHWPPWGPGGEALWILLLINSNRFFFFLLLSEADRNPLESFLGTVEHEYGAQVSVFDAETGHRSTEICAPRNSGHVESRLVSLVWQQFWSWGLNFPWGCFWLFGALKCSVWIAGICFSRGNFKVSHSSHCLFVSYFRGLFFLSFLIGYDQDNRVCCK